MARSRVSDLLVCIQHLVAGGPLPYTMKVREYIEENEYEEADIRNAIMTAKRIHKSEPDEMHAATDGMKHVIIGRNLEGRPFYLCGKIIQLPTGMRAFQVMTAHAARDRQRR